MKVSIIIPVYNAEKYLKECIESALNQTYDDIEIIAVNDGSTDDSINILKKYSDRIEIIEKENGGIGSALNAGIKAATGEWIKKIDADDVLYPNAVELLIAEVKKLGNAAKSCIFYTNYEVIDGSGKKLYDFIEPNYNDLSNFKRGVILLDHCVGNHITSLIPKSIFEKCGLFSINTKNVEDYEFWLRCQLLHDCRFILLNEITAKYRVHQGQLTQTKRKITEENSKVARDVTLKQINPILKAKYLDALNNFQKKKYPIKIRIIRTVRDFLINSLPEPLSKKILNASIRSKTANDLYRKVMSSWTE